MDSPRTSRSSRTCLRRPSRIDPASGVLSVLTASSSKLTASSVAGASSAARSEGRMAWRLFGGIPLGPRHVLLLLFCGLQALRRARCYDSAPQSANIHQAQEGAGRVLASRHPPRLAVHVSGFSTCSTDENRLFKSKLDVLCNRLIFGKRPAPRSTFSTNVYDAVEL
eukprot:2022635-Prymnesium_polylepis.1